MQGHQRTRHFNASSKAGPLQEASAPSWILSIGSTCGRYQHLQPNSLAILGRTSGQGMLAALPQTSLAFPFFQPAHADNDDEDICYKLDDVADDSERHGCCCIDVEEYLCHGSPSRCLTRTTNLHLACYICQA